MTSLVTESTESIIESGSVETLTGGIGLVVVVLVVLLMIEQELLRVRGGDTASPSTGSLSVAVFPLACVAAAVLGARFLELLA
jgi:hypothetical protein